MTDWPTAPLIKVVRGRDLGELKENMIAARIDDTGNYIGARCVFAREVDRDSIDEWEEVTAVPTAALKRLQDAFRGVDMTSALIAALQGVTSHLPADRPSPLDQAVTDAKNIGARGILEDFPLNDRIALLLSAVNEVHTGEDRRYRLAWVVRLAYTWADLEAPDKDALQIIRNHAATGVGGRSESLAILARQVGGVAAAVSDGRSPRAVLLALGARALAWAAKIIEEEGE